MVEQRTRGEGGGVNQRSREIEANQLLIIRLIDCLIVLHSGLSTSMQRRSFFLKFRTETTLITSLIQAIFQLYFYCFPKLVYVKRFRVLFHIYLYEKKEML